MTELVKRPKPIEEAIEEVLRERKKLKRLKSIKP